MIPFAKTKDERTGNNDPYPSLQERYGDHAGYVAAVTTATANARAQGFLLEEDEAALIGPVDDQDLQNQNKFRSFRFNLKGCFVTYSKMHRSR